MYDSYMDVRVMKTNQTTPGILWGVTWTGTSLIHASESFAKSYEGTYVLISPQHLYRNVRKVYGVQM
jgi:hypothetical protein